MLRMRPEFSNVEEYIDHMAGAIAAGVEPWEPATISELKAAIKHFPEIAQRWVPNSAIIWQTKSFHFLINPWKLRLIESLRNDAEFQSQLFQQLWREVGK